MIAPAAIYTAPQRRTASLLAVALAFGAVVVLDGCLSRPSLRTEAFIFNVPMVTNAPAVTTSRVLGIHPLSIAGPFDSQSFVYRTGEFSYEHDPYAQFLVPPAEALRPALEGDFRQAGVFRDIAERGSLLRANTRLEVYVKQLYGDFRKSTPPAAVLEMELIFLEAGNGNGGKVLLQKQ